MTVADLAQFCCQTVGDISSEMVDYAKRAIRLKYQTLYDAHAWRESMRTLDQLVVDPGLNGSIFLPFDAEEVIFLSLSNDGRSYARLSYRERDWIERATGPQFSLPGNMPWFYKGENLAWPYLNPGIVTFTTSDQTPFNVYIEGKDTGGFPRNETFIMSASVQTNPPGPDIIIPSSVATVNSYSLITVLSKDGGNLNIQATQPLTPMNLTPADSSLLFSQVVLYPCPLFFDQNNNPRPPLYARMQVKLKADTLDHDMAVPRVSHITDALIEFTLGALWRRARQITKAQAADQAAMLHVQAAINVEKNQAEFSQQVVPTVYESNSYLDGGICVDSANPFGW